MRVLELDRQDGGPVEAVGRMNAEVFRREGEYWTLVFAGSVARLRDTKGLQYLARLLAHPGRDFGVLELAEVACAGPVSTTFPGPDEGLTAGPSAERGAEAERMRSAVTKRIKDALKRIEACHPTLGRHLSVSVKTGYRCAYRPDPERPFSWAMS